MTTPKAIYLVSPLGRAGQVIPCRLPYESPFDPFDGNRRVLLIDDSVFAARGAIGGKSRSKILDSTVNVANELGTKSPMQLPQSCTAVSVTSERGYCARYQIAPLSYAACTVRITETDPEFAEYQGQPFTAELAKWPYGRPEERRAMAKVRITEPLPYGDDTNKSTAMAMEMVRGAVPPGWGFHITGRNLQMGTADVIGFRVRPESGATGATGKAVTKTAGKRRN